MEQEIDIRVMPLWSDRTGMQGVQSATLVVLFDGGMECWNVGVHRVGVTKRDLAQ